jgi:hypothetical protein
MRLLAFTTLLLVFFIEAKTQTHPSGRISINSGARVVFDFNTLNKFSNGLEKPNYTEIKIDFIDTDNNLGWEFGVQASSAFIDPSFESVSGLPLNIIEISTTTCPSCTPIILESGFQILAEEIWPGGGLGVEKIVSEIINLSYYCNKGYVIGNIPINLADYVNDTYVVELEFTLRRKQ